MECFSCGPFGQHLLAKIEERVFQGISKPKIQNTEAHPCLAALHTRFQYLLLHPALTQEVNFSTTPTLAYVSPEKSPVVHTCAEEVEVSVRTYVDLSVILTPAYAAKRELSRTHTPTKGLHTRSITQSHTSGYLGSGGHEISPSASETARVRRLPSKLMALANFSDAQTGGPSI